MLVEVLFTSRVAGHKIGDVVEYHDHTLLFKALLNGKHVEILNPPDWSPRGSTKKEGESIGSDHNQTNTIQEHRGLTRYPKNTNHKSGEDSGSSPETGP